MSFVRVVTKGGSEHIGMKLECVGGTDNFRLWTNSNVYNDLGVDDIAMVEALKDAAALEIARGGGPSREDA